MAAVCGRTLRWTVCQSKQVGFSKLGITSAARARDLKETECYKLVNCGTYRMAMNSVIHEIIIGYGQPAIIASTMMGKFDFDAVEYFSGAQAEHAPCWRFQHCYEVGRELSADTSRFPRHSSFAPSREKL